MPEPKDRTKLEKDYARLMAKLLAAYGGRLLEKLGDPPSLDNLPKDFWDEEALTLVRALSPFGQQVYLDAARQLMEQTPIGVDWALINQRAIDWASGYTFELVTGINDTTRQTVQQAIGAFFEEGLTRGDLEDRISPLFGPVRASVIAVTEVTRASSQGEQAMAKELAEQGIEMVPIWQTNNDEGVCGDEDSDPSIFCVPRHDMVIKDDLFPPLHPNCRCWVNYELPKVE